MSSDWDAVIAKGDQLLEEALNRLYSHGLALNRIQDRVPVLVRPRVFYFGSDLYWPSNEQIDYTHCQGGLSVDWVCTELCQACLTPKDYTRTIHHIERAITWCEDRIAGLERAQGDILRGQEGAVEEIEARVGLHALEEM